MRRVLKLALATAALGFAAAASPAAAATCDPAAATGTTSGTAATDCAGYFDGNLLGGSQAMRDAAGAALSDLTGTTITIDQATFNALLTDNSLPIDFGPDLFGQVLIGIHEGNDTGEADNKSQTVFYLFNFTSPESGITLSGNDLQKFSGATLYTNGGAVPEPATWAMMLIGFGGIGMAMRRSRKVNGRLAQIA